MKVQKIETETVFKLPTLKRPCYKMITCDVDDEIIDLQASVIVGVSNYSCTKARRRFIESNPDKKN